MKKLAILGNPNAGKGRASQALIAAKRTLWGWPYEVILPRSAGDLTRACADLDPERYEAAIVVGGDGTLNHAIRGLVASQVPLYTFPGGTANDLAREMGILPDWAQAQFLLDQKRRKRIDLVEVNGIPFATVAGIGLGAKLTYEYNSRRAQSPLFRAVSRALQSEIYTLMSLKVIMTDWSSSSYVHVKARNFDEKVKTSCLFICNQSKLGGDIHVAPEGANTDKLFNVLIIPRTSSLGMMRAFIAMKTAESAPKLPHDFILFSASEVSIREVRGKPLRLFGDGDILTQSSRFDFQLIEKPLEVYFDRRRAPSVTVGDLQ